LGTHKFELQLNSFPKSNNSSLFIQLAIFGQKVQETRRPKPAQSQSEPTRYKSSSFDRFLSPREHQSVASGLESVQSLCFMRRPANIVIGSRVGRTWKFLQALASKICMSMGKVHKFCTSCSSSLIGSAYSYIQKIKRRQF
jgi:hypothetical protein